MSKTICCCLTAGAVWGFATVRGAELPARFLGANSCASSSCHGGGGANQNQYLVWSLKDFHSQRPAATLATARSKQIADALGIRDATEDDRCTTCHAPLKQVPANLRGKDFKVGEGVSCESCHGPAGNWIRSHMRTDYTRTDRTAAGMRELENVYVRANTCVACHQNVDADILRAGHPELIFELDGQSVAEPKHWRVEKNGNGAQAWLVGQAVALREMSWQIVREKSSSENALNRWTALQWLVMDSSTATTGFPMMVAGTYKPGGFEKTVQSWSDEFAHAASRAVWSNEMTRKLLFTLADSSAAFRDGSVSQNLQARRAERLVLALDRLVAALPELKSNEPVQAALNRLFQLAQSVPDFDPKQFAAALQTFSAALPARPRMQNPP